MSSVNFAIPDFCSLISEPCVWRIVSGEPVLPINALRKRAESHFRDAVPRQNSSHSDPSRTGEGHAQRSSCGVGAAARARSFRHLDSVGCTTVTSSLPEHATRDESRSLLKLAAESGENRVLIQEQQIATDGPRDLAQS